MGREAFHSVPFLTEIDSLVRNALLDFLRTSSLQAFTDVLPGKLELQHFNLRENELEDDGAICIAKSISTLDKLETVDFSQNQVSIAYSRVCYLGATLSCAAPETCYLIFPCMARAHCIDKHGKKSSASQTTSGADTQPCDLQALMKPG